MKIHHTITYPDGRHFEGKVDHRNQPALLGLESANGLRVLDIASNDGFFAFWSEWSGASEVVAIDVERYEDYDWGPNGPPSGIETMEQPDKSRVFWSHHGNLKSAIRRRQQSVYELRPEMDGRFDLIFNYGLLYHLRHPLMALEKCASVCRGVMALETHVNMVNPWLPYSMFFPQGFGSVAGDFNAPTPSCVAVWLKLAGFVNVFIEMAPAKTRRCRFLATMTDHWAEKCRSNPKFSECDEQFWATVDSATKERPK